MKLDGYIRVSRTGGRSGEQFISPDVQRDQIASWAKLRGTEIVEWHTDLDQSGGKLKRPGLDAVLARIKSGQTEGVAVARLDRLSRVGVGEALRLIESITEDGGVVAAVDLGLDPTTTLGEFATTLMLALARMERRRIADGWAAATERAIARGAHGHAAFGYVATSDGRLEPDPIAGPLVEELFRRRQAGQSWTELVRFLDECHPPVRGNQWTRRAVENITRNRVYLGEARYGEHTNAAAHKPLVDAGLFDAVQHARAPRPARGNPALLSGLVRCAGCRHRMTASVVGSRKQLVYRCKRRHGEGTCPSPASVTRDLLDSYVTASLLEAARDIAVRAATAEQPTLDAQRAVETAEADLVAYRDNTAAREALDAVGPAAFADGLRERAQRVLQARETLAQLARATQPLVSTDIDTWEALTISQRRMLLGEAIDAVFLRRASVAGRNTGLDASRVRVLWRGEAPNDLPGPGRRVELTGFDW